MAKNGKLVNLIQISMFSYTMIEKIVPFALPFPNIMKVFSFIIHIFRVEFQHFSLLNLIIKRDEDNPRPFLTIIFNPKILHQRPIRWALFHRILPFVIPYASKFLLRSAQDAHRTSRKCPLERNCLIPSEKLLFP